MKRKITALSVLCLSMMSALTSCNDNSSHEPTSSITEPSESKDGSTTTKKDDETTNPTTTEEKTTTDSTQTTEDSAEEIANLKTSAIAKLDSYISAPLKLVSNEDLKSSINSFYTIEKAYIESIDDLETAKQLSTKIDSDLLSYVNNTLKTLCVTKLNDTINPLIDQITDETLKTSVQNYYNTQIEKISKATTLSDLVSSFNEIITDTKSYITSQTQKLLATLKNKGIETLDTYIAALIEKVPYESLKSDLNTFYTSEKSKLEAVEKIEDVEFVINVIKTDLDNFVITESKKVALANLDKLVNDALENLSNEELKTSLNNFYTTEKSYIESINDLESAQKVAEKITSDTKAYLNNTLKDLSVAKINEIINPLIENISDEELKTSIQNYYNIQIEKVSKVENLSDLVAVYNSIISDTKAYIKEETEKLLIELKNKGIETLDSYVSTLIEKIPYETVKTDLNSFYTSEKSKLEAIEKLEDVSPTIEEIKADLEKFALDESKKIAVSKLEEVVTEGLNKIPNEDLKKDLTSFKDDEIKKINAITKLEDVSPTLTTVLNETEDYIKKLLAKTVKDYLVKLTSVETTNAYDYLPEAMSCKYNANIVNASDINYDFTTDTNVSSILKQGFGEQWQMVVENINQSVTMASVFNVAQTALNAAGNSVNIYLENSYSDSINYEFTGEGYTGVFKFENSKLIFNVTMTKAVDVPGIGSVKPVVKMEYDLTEEAKGMFISLGDSYKLKYVIRDNAYEMATNYGMTISGKNVSRSSYLSIVKENDKTTGHIYEYTTYEGSDKVKACADFYVEGDYVSVVGNKATGMTAFDGYINELYKASEGRLVGYEVRETQTVSGASATYNTLWFNIWDISGIDSIKVLDKSDSNKSGKSTVDVYLNGSSKLFSPTYNTKFGVKTSRKYDVELRSRFYYTYDAENDKYVANKVLVPMMFIQEDNDVDTNFTDYPSDMKKANDIDSKVILDQALLDKILVDYDTYIDIFIQNKENMSSDEINEYLKQYE